jgi:hypothetical protein
MAHARHARVRRPALPAVPARALASLALAACAPVPHVDAPTTPTNVSAGIDPETFTNRITGLRATLSRSHVELDTASVDTCTSAADHNCVRCEVATSADTTGLDPDLLDGVAITFASYPPGFLTAAHLEHVVLCRRIDYGDHPDVRPGGVALAGDHRMLVSIEHFATDHFAFKDYTIEQIVHHELFHLIDREQLGLDGKGDRTWNALNPSGFAYQDPAPSETKRPRGFVNAYATTNEFEDRASVFEYLIGQPDALCAMLPGDPILAAKTKAVWKRIAKIAGGEKFLRAHASCVVSPPPVKPSGRKAPNLELPAR